MEDPEGFAMPQGFYPRVNAKLLASGAYNNSTIISLVGHFLSGAEANADGRTIPFKASDGGIVTLAPDEFEMPLIGPDSPPFEVIGVLQPAGYVQIFVLRELTKDMDMEIYDKMLDVQMNPKFASYFSPVPAG